MNCADDDTTLLEAAANYGEKCFIMWQVLYISDWSKRSRCISHGSIWYSHRDICTFVYIYTCIFTCGLWHSCTWTYVNMNVYVYSCILEFTYVSSNTHSLFSLPISVYVFIVNYMFLRTYDLYTCRCVSASVCKMYIDERRDNENENEIKWL